LALPSVSLKGKIMEVFDQEGIWQKGGVLEKQHMVLCN
jgi:hypothetical protein